jgi:hypothetical protein
MNFLDRHSKNTKNIKFHENPSSGSRVVTRGGTDRVTDRQTDMKKLVVAFCTVTNAPKNENDIKVPVYKTFITWMVLQIYKFILNIFRVLV